MKIVISLALVASAMAGGSSKIPVNGTCYLEWNQGGGKYQRASGTAMCDTGLDCNSGVIDDGITGEIIEGICENANCQGKNSGGSPEEGTHRMTICHRTCSETNPWVRITIDEDAWNGSGCGHQEHDILFDCNMNVKNRTKWGANHKDYLIKDHGTRADVRAKLEALYGLAPGELGNGGNPGQTHEIEKAYWRHWEPACPFVRGTACCDWATGDCCGDAPATITKVAGIRGDPHIKRWDRKEYHFHGICDMVLAKSPNVGQTIDGSFKPFAIHVRTRSAGEYVTSVHSAVMKLGVDTVQIDMQETGAPIWYLNGSPATLPIVTDEFTVPEPEIVLDVTRYKVDIANSESSVHFETVANSFMNVLIQGTQFDFGDSVGLVGSFNMGKSIDRNGARIANPNDFATTWQVNPAVDGTLFRTTANTVQYPTPCTIKPAQPTRRLGENKELAKQAYTACASKENVEACMSDVMATGLLAAAQGW